MIRRTTLTGTMLCLMLAGACAAGTERSADEPTKQETDLRQKDGEELVEITIRMPDGRVIKRKERKIASRVEGDLPALTENRPPIVSKRTTGDIDTLDGGVSGGSNAGGVQTGGGSAGGGGSSTSRAGGGGGGGDDGTRAPGGGGHSGGVSDGDDIIQPVQPDDDLTVRLYAWSNTGAPFDHIQEAIVADPRGKSPEQLARSISQQVSRSDHDKVVLRFWKEFFPATTHPFDTSNPRQLIQLGGYSDGLTQYWTHFADELARLGVVPDYLIFDQEQGISFWHIPSGARRAFFEELLDPNQPLNAGLPDTMRGVRVEDFINFRSSEGQQAFDDYNKYAMQFRSNFLRRVFVEPLNSAFGRDIHASNYWDTIAGFPIIRYTGREMQYATIAGISAPVTYLDMRGDSGVRYSRTNKHERWNRLIDKLNFVRSTAQPGWTTPWVAPPGYGRNGPDTWARANQLDEEYWLWETLMNHMVAMGIDTFILWNPQTRFNPNAVVTDAFMDNWHSRNQRVPTNQLRNLAPIPLDADQIVTNGVVTTYDEFLDMMNISDDE